MITERNPKGSSEGFKRKHTGHAGNHTPITRKFRQTDGKAEPPDRTR